MRRTPAGPAESLLALGHWISIEIRNSIQKDHEKSSFSQPEACDEYTEITQKITINSKSELVVKIETTKQICASDDKKYETPGNQRADGAHQAKSTLSSIPSLARRRFFSSLSPFCVFYVCSAARSFQARGREGLPRRLDPI